MVMIILLRTRRLVTMWQVIGDRGGVVKKEIVSLVLLDTGVELVRRTLRRMLVLLVRI